MLYYIIILLAVTYIDLFACVLRVLWAKYFDTVRMRVAFFSAVEETNRLKDKVYHVKFIHFRTIDISIIQSVHINCVCIHQFGRVRIN